MKKGLKYTLWVLLAFVVIDVAVGFYMLNVSLKPDYEGRDERSSLSFVSEKYPWTAQWLDSLKTSRALRDTFITAPDGARLHGYFLPSTRPTAHTALLVHGYTDNGLRMLMLGYMYQHVMGYNVILPDLRNAGRSDGDHFQMGWRDRLDVEQWMNLAPHLFGDSVRMVVHGISMGAATTMMLSGDSLPVWVKCFVEDCGYTSVWDEFAYELKSRYGLPEFPVLSTASLLCKLRYGWSFTEASALEQVKKCRRPMFFIHGNRDTYVPFAMLAPLYAAKSQPKEQWITPGVIHAESYKTYPEAYTQRVSRFVGRWMEKK